MNDHFSYYYFKIKMSGKLGIMKAGYYFVAGIGYTSVGLHLEMLQLQSGQR